MKARALFAFLFATLIWGSAAALELTACVTHSDVGLHDSRGGAALGVTRQVLHGDGPLELLVGAEYVQRRGAQPRYFSDPVQGLVLGNAEVTLHYLQPVIFAARSFQLSQFEPRLYGGFSFALKVGETWDQPAGQTNGEIGFQDTDLLVHLGTSIASGSYFLDFRFSWGLTRQVVDNTDARVTKAAETLEEGLDDFADGNKVTGFHGGLGFRF